MSFSPTVARCVILVLILDLPRKRLLFEKLKRGIERCVSGDIALEPAVTAMPSRGISLLGLVQQPCSRVFKLFLAPPTSVADAIFEQVEAAQPPSCASLDDL
jgi:hypothetical protein